MALHEFDVLIVGAGPAGCTLALNLAGKGLSIAVIEKNIFPRHKICGDALSGKVLSVMKRLPGGVYDDFLLHVPKTPTWGIRFVAPNHHHIDVPFVHDRVEDQPAPGFVCKRSDFDGFIFSKMKDYPEIRIFEGEPVTEAATFPEYARVRTVNHEFRGQMIAGADGVHSIVRRSLHHIAVDKKNCCVGIRCYYENVTGEHPENYIELHFLKNLLPGYFWIFPSTAGLVNAGFGMLQNRLSEHREHMTGMLHDIIANDPLIAPRFLHARQSGKPGAHILPLGTMHLERSGQRFLLLGDAGFLVDPFSGEGIGNAMASGEIAADILEKNFIQHDFSADAMAAYDVRINRRFADEFRTMSVMQRLAGSPWLFNLVVDKAGNNKEVGKLLTDMFNNENIRKKLTRPGFYARLLFR